MLDSHATRLLDDGLIGDYIRGEITAVACDNRQLWIDIAYKIIDEMNGFIETVESKQ